MPLPQEGRKYTYADYLTWPEGERWEILDGVPSMQVAPTWQHQAISVQLTTQFNAHLKGTTCRVFAAPFDLCIPDANERDEEISNITQPDIVVICDESKLRKTGYFGVPALIIEISSPSTAKQDKLLKFNNLLKSAAATRLSRWMYSRTARTASTASGWAGASGEISTLTDRH